MDAHAPAEGHAHPGPALYLKIGITLAVLTAAEVALYDITDKGRPAAIAQIFGPIFVESLLFLSAIKFALVAMFYMHLKQDHKLFSGLLVFPLTIAAVIVLALITLFGYLHHLHPGLK